MRKSIYCYRRTHLKSYFTGLICLLFFSITNSYSQVKSVPLITFLEEIELKHDISFSYSDEDVKPVNLPGLDKELSLEESINHIESNSNLKIEKISDQYYAIKLAESKKNRLCGYLIDIESQYPIALATIQAGNQTVISDSLGFFEIEELIQNEINIQHLSYESEQFRISADSECTEYYLVPKLQILPEVLIPDYLVSGIDKMANGQLQVNTNELQILPGLIEPDVLFSLQAFPGISSYNESVANINIRGGTNDQNLVLWDGIRMYQTGHFFGLISAINPYTVNEVTITKNGTSAAFGDAVSGLLEINSNSKTQSKLQTHGGFNLLNADAVLQLPISSKVNLQVSARRSISDIFDSPTFKSYSDRAFRDTEILSNNVDTADFSNESFEYIDFNTKVNAQLSKKDKISFSLIGIANNLEHEEAGVVNNESIYKNSNLTQKSFGIGSTYLRKWNSKWSSTTSISNSTYVLESNNYDIGNSQLLIQENTINDFNLKLNQTYNLNDQINFHGGYQYSNISIENLEDLDNPSFQRRIVEILNTHTLFTEINYLSTDMKTQSRFGIRMNNYQDIGKITIEPRLSLNHQLSESIAIEVLAESKSQSLVQIIDLQNDFLGVEKRRWVIVNENDIPLLKSTQGSIGFQYSDAGWMFTVDGYMKQVDGIITSSQAFQNQFELIRESGSYLVQGMELLFNKKIDRFSSWISYSYSQNEYVFSPLNTSKFVSNFDIPHQLTLGLGYKGDHLQISSNANWRSGRPFTNPGEPTVIGGVVNYLHPNTERQENYLRIDLSGKYWFNISPKLIGEVGIAFWNLTSRENILNTYFRNEGLNGARRIENLALGFTPNAMFRLRFKQ